MVQMDSFCPHNELFYASDYPDRRGHKGHRPCFCDNVRSIYYYRYNLIQI